MEEDARMIPKTIHYCWFGGNPLPELARKCIESWKKYCPDYEIIEWNETNYDVGKCAYMKEAYQAKKWGFVPDYARFDIIYSHGGIYLDTDVEIVRNLDELLENRAFMGFESADYVNPGLIIGGEAGNPEIAQIMRWYESHHFIMESGEIDLTASPAIVTAVLLERGLHKEQSVQLLNGALTIYPKDYFCPMDYYTGDITITDNTYTIHHYSASWLSNRQKKWLLLGRKLHKTLSPTAYQRVSRSHLYALIGVFYTRGMKAGFKLYIKKIRERVRPGK